MYEMLVFLIVLSFVAEYIDASLGMGYGTILAPILMMLGFIPSMIVPFMLLSQFLAGTLSGASHHLLENMDLAGNPHQRTSFRVFAVTGIVGVAVAAISSTALPTFFVEVYIALVVILMGVVILIDGSADRALSFRKIAIIGLFGAFNKGISGGGYGPIVTGGQMISGIEPRAAVAITSIVEAVMCAFGFVFYFLIAPPTDLVPLLGIIIGALLAAPLSAFTVSKVSQTRIKRAIAVATIVLGVATGIWILTTA